MKYIPAQAGMTTKHTIPTDRIVIRLTPRPRLLDSGFRRNDDGVLFWLYVITAHLQKANRKNAKSVLTCLITLTRIEPAHRLEAKARSV